MGSQTATADVIDLNKRLLEKREALGIRTPTPEPKPTRPREMLSVARKPASCDNCAVLLSVEEVDLSWRAVKFLCATCTDLQLRRQWWKRAGDIGSIMLAAGVRDAHVEAGLADFSSDTFDRALSVARRESAGLFVCGAEGRGKTYLAAAIARYALLSGCTVRFVMARRLLREIWETYRDEATVSESEIINRLVKVDLLVIDDLGPGREGRVSPAVIGAIHEILSERSDRRRPTVVTTNRSLDQIGTDYDKAIRSRLGAFDCVVLRGDDRRLGRA